MTDLPLPKLYRNASRLPWICLIERSPCPDIGPNFSTLNRVSGRDTDRKIRDLTCIAFTLVILQVW